MFTKIFDVFKPILTGSKNSLEPYSLSDCVVICACDLKGEAGKDGGPPGPPGLPGPPGEIVFPNVGDVSLHTLRQPHTEEGAHTLPFY